MTDSYLSPNNVLWLRGDPMTWSTSDVWERYIGYNQVGRYWYVVSRGAPVAEATRQAVEAAG